MGDRREDREYRPRQAVYVSAGGLEYRVTPHRRGAWVVVRVRPDGLPRLERWVPFLPMDETEVWEIAMTDFTDMLPGGSGDAVGQVPDADFQGTFPRLWWILTTDKLPDGKPRKRASLSFSCQSDGWAAFLNEKTSNQYLCRSGATLELCLLALEEALGERPVAWRTNGTQTRRR